MRKATTDTEGARFREIVAILARHRVARGVSPATLRHVLEDLGPTFVKLGQILSMRGDMLPAAYCEELSHLRADAQAMPFSEVRAVVEGEYGRPLEAVFRSFCEEPIGAASIAQAHEAYLLADGRRVVAKVQRPGIRERMALDVKLLRRATAVTKLTAMGAVIDLGMVLDEMWAVAQEELDFTVEAGNLETFRKNCERLRYADCPRVERELSTDRVLVMEYVDGLPIDDPDALREAGYDPDDVASKLADHYVRQVVDDGFFQADPHPGNLRVRGGQIVWLDMGMTGRLSEGDRALFRDGMRAIADHDVERLKNIVLTLGAYTGRIDHALLYGDIEDFLTKYGSAELGSLNLGVAIDELMRVAKRNGIAMPKGMSMLGRGMLTIEGVLEALSPKISVLSVVAARMSGELFNKDEAKRTLAHALRQARESTLKASGLPAQLSDLLRLSAKGQTKFNVELTGSEKPLSALDMSLVRLTRALLSGACVIGAAIVYGEARSLAVGLLIAAAALAAWALVRRKER